MTPEDFKAAMQADKEATRAKWQGMVDEVFGKKPVQIVARLNVNMDQVRQQIDEAADRVMRRASIITETSISNPETGEETTHIETIGAEIPAQDADAAFWAKVPDGYDLVVMCSNGDAYPYHQPPIFDWCGWGLVGRALRSVPELKDYHPRNDWQNSLRHRPEGL